MNNIYKSNYMKGMVLSLLSLLLTLAGGKIMAQSQCDAQFNAYTSQGVTTFFDSSFVSSGTITAYTWSFGDGSGATGGNPTHIYNSAGTYTVCLTIVTSAGCSDSICKPITIGNPCNLTATSVYDSLQANIIVFPAGGTAPYNYSWTNGANTQSIGAVVPGSYCCVVSDANGCYYTTCITVPGSSQCFANFVHTQQGNMVAFSNSSSGFSSLVWDFGDGQTSTSTSPVHTYIMSGTYNVCLSLYSNGALCSSICDTVVVGTQGSAYICGNIFNDLNANSINNNEPGFAGGYLVVYGNGIQTSLQLDSLGNYSANLPPGSYTISYCAPQPYTLTLPQDSGACGFYQITVGANDSICGFNFGVTNNKVKIEGNVFIDTNNNGVLDAGEYGAAYQAVQIGSQWVYTDANGSYSWFVPVGSYTITYTPSGIYSGYPLSTPASIALNAPTIGVTYSGNNFGINIPPGTVNLGVQLLPHTTITPGFPAWYDIQVCNYGVTPVGANVSMNYDAGLTVDYSYPNYTSNNTSTHTLSWTLSPIAPGSCVNIRVDFDASTGYVIGTSTFEEVTVSPTSGIDINLSNNTDTIHQIVTGSWDPNNKLSIQTNFNDPNYQVISSINSNQQIQYTINFQNLGTAPAVNVVVQDVLAANVDAASFQMIAASHNVSVSRNGGNVTYNFPNIMLQDATTNEPFSHGFVSYTVNAISGLSAGTQISDFANIYFDFNTPVATNNAVVTMVNPTGINEVISKSLLNTYPNPVKEQATLQFYINNTSDVSIDMIDVSGRSVSILNQQKLGNGVHETGFNVNGYANGVYVLKLTVNGNSSFTKISVAH